MSEWDTWTDEDRAWLLALDQVETDRQAAACPLCGDTTGQCRDANLQHAWKAKSQVCYRTKTILEKSRSFADDPLAGRVFFRTSLDLSRAKVPVRRGNRTTLT